MVKNILMFLFGLCLMGLGTGVMIASELGSILSNHIIPELIMKDIL